MFDTQLSDFSNFDFDSVIFYNPESINHSETNESFKKIKIAVKNKDGSIGDLIFSTPSSLFSFGIQEIHDNQGRINGYIMPISLWKKRQPTEEETEFQTVLQTLIDLSKECVEHYVEQKIDLKRFSPLSFRKTFEENNNKEETKAPLLYTKLIYNKRDEKINTIFIDEHTNAEISPLSILSKRCLVTGAIKIDSIFIGEKITLQVKLYEALINVIQKPQRLLLSHKK